VHVNSAGFTGAAFGFSATAHGPIAKYRSPNLTAMEPSPLLRVNVGPRQPTHDRLALDLVQPAVESQGGNHSAPASFPHGSLTMPDRGPSPAGDGHRRCWPVPPSAPAPTTPDTPRRDIGWLARSSSLRLPASLSPGDLGPSRNFKSKDLTQIGQLLRGGANRCASSCARWCSSNLPAD